MRRDRRSIRLRRSEPVAQDVSERGHRERKCERRIDPIGFVATRLGISVTLIRNGLDGSTWPHPVVACIATFGQQSGVKWPCWKNACSATIWMRTAAAIKM